MKTFISYLFVAAFLLSPLNMSKAGAELVGPIETVKEFFEVSRIGDIESIKNLITGPLYNSRKALLEKNQGYAEYLRKYYENITVRIVHADIQSANGSATVFLKRRFSDGKELDTKLLLKRDENGIWKIYDEILED